MSDLFTDMAAMRDRAVFFTAKRRKDRELYALLSDCMSLAERCEAEGMTDDIKSRVTDEAGGRSYFEQGADAFLVVGRYVFGSGERRACSWRYTATMREAAKHGLTSKTLAQWLSENGGINALFRARKVASRSARTKTLHLNQQIEVPKSGAIALVIQRDERGFFDVLSCDKFEQLRAAE